MLKHALTFLALATGTAVAVRTGEGVYSRFQLQLFPGTGLKVMQDPANVWSWHKVVPAFDPTLYRESVLIDFDGNGRMDTEDPDVRVVVTDAQVVFPDSGNIRKVWLGDGTRRRWLLLEFNGSPATTRDVHFATPWSCR